MSCAAHRWPHDAEDCPLCCELRIQAGIVDPRLAEWTQADRRLSELLARRGWTAYGRGFWGKPGIDADAIGALSDDFEQLDAQVAALTASVEALTQELATERAKHLKFKVEVCVSFMGPVARD